MKLLFGNVKESMIMALILSVAARAALRHYIAGNPYFYGL
jgi:hypothetical protein